MRFRRSWCRIASVVGTFAVAAACSEPQVGGTGQTAGSTSAAQVADSVRVPDAPTFGSADTAQRSAVVEYARRVRFVSDLRLSDEQTLVQPRGRGPRARVEAAEYAHRLSRVQLARGAVIARFISDGEYSPLGLNSGVAYFFVDSVAGAGWRAIIVPDDASRRPKVMGMVITESPHRYEVPGVRWVQVGDLIYPNPPCGRECCVPCEPPLYPCPSRPGMWPPVLDTVRLGRPAVPAQGVPRG